MESKDGQAWRENQEMDWAGTVGTHYDVVDSHFAVHVFCQEQLIAFI